VGGDAPDPARGGDILEVRPGAHIGRYVIESQLGAGGMGIVYAALDSELHRRVALKLLRPDRHDDIGKVGRERLLREARTLARLSHPNVVTVFDVGEHDGHLFVAMELVDGGSLVTWLRKEPKPRDIVDRMLEAGRGLAAAHAAGVVHRDVKPDNILVGLDGRARMTDFGLAHLGDVAPLGGITTETLTTTITRTGTLIGTPAYMAPEHLVRGETNATTDQWSYCATLYEALAGVRPFPVVDLAMRSSAIADGRLVPPATGRRVPAWVKPTMQRGLHPDPARRWPSMAALVAAIERRRNLRRNVALALAAVAVLATASVSIATRPRAKKAPRVELIMGAPMQPDERPGCDCPYSACRNGCVGVCRPRGFTVGSHVPGLDVVGRQEAVCGATSDGESILFLAGERCALDHLYLAHRRGEKYEPVDLTDQLDGSRVAIVEGCCTLAADGSGLVVLARDHKSFLWAALDAHKLSPLDGSAFGQLVPGSPEGASVLTPVLTADGLTLYYNIHDAEAQRGQPGPRDGIYVATRTDLRSPFTQPQRLIGKAQKYDYVSGVSTDNLTLFLTSDYMTFTLSRADTTEPFGFSADNLGKLYGWRTIPLAGCGRILTTDTPGGCASEDIIFLESYK
jgi:tRNA A-37 threonylcarbamoyl transferase component Bud32